MKKNIFKEKKNNKKEVNAKITVSEASALFIPQLQLSSLGYLINDYWVGPDTIEQASL